MDIDAPSPVPASAQAPRPVLIGLAGQGSVGKTALACAILRTYPQAIINDEVRTLDEAKQILEKGGIIIQVTRPGYVSSIPSELVTETLPNDGDLETFLEEGTTLVEKYMQ